MKSHRKKKVGTSLNRCTPVFGILHDMVQHSLQGASGVHAFVQRKTPFGCSCICTFLTQPHAISYENINTIKNWLFIHVLYNVKLLPFVLYSKKCQYFTVVLVTCQVYESLGKQGKQKNGIWQHNTPCQLSPMTPKKNVRYFIQTSHFVLNIYYTFLFQSFRAWFTVTFCNTSHSSVIHI